MAVAEDALGTEATATPNASSAFNYTGLTVVSNTNGAIVLIICTLAANDTVGSVTGYTLIQSGTNGIAHVEIWGKVGNSTGLQTISITPSAGYTNGDSMRISAISVTGADQTGGATTFPNSAVNTGNSATPSSGAITTSTSDLVVSALSIGNAVNSLSNIQIFLDGGGGASAQYEVGGASPQTLTWGTGSAAWVVASTDIAAVATAIVETNTFFKGKTYFPQWNPDARLFRTTAQDFSSFGVETNPHWRGRVFPLQWNIKRDWMPPQDTSSFGVETNPHWQSRTWPLQWTLNSLLRNSAQDFSSFGVETNPHWQSRTWSVVWAPTVALARLSAIDVLSVQADTPIYYRPLVFLLQWAVQKSLMQATAQDLSSLGVATSVHYVPRTWPAQWNLQASLMRGAPQDFSTLPPTSQPVYARYGASHGIGTLSAIPGEIPS